MIGHRMAGAGLVAVAAVCGLTGCGSSGGAPSATASTSAVAGAPVAGGTTSARPASGVADGLAAAACRTWAMGTSQDSAARTTTVAAAARQANVAARRDSHWAALATEMTFVSSLPETGNSPADQQRAVADEQDITGECSALGVTVGN